ncbi:hypothetical protein SERLA73DRAFT_143215, partial [Serpula lacrymans var. lacrymans S7.3]
MPAALTQNCPTIRQQLDKTVENIFHQLIHRCRTVSNDDDDDNNEDNLSIHSSASLSDQSISSA